MDNIEQAKQLIEDGRRARAAECMKEIEASLTKHQCHLDVTFTVRMTTREPLFDIQIVPNEN